MRVEAGVSGPRFHLDHLFTQRRLSAYLDGELGPSSSGRIKGHIEQCSDCDDAARSLPRWMFEQPHEWVPLVILALVPAGRVWGLDRRFASRGVQRLRRFPF